MNRHSLGSAPDYTLAALVSLGANLFCLLVGVWVTFGFPAALLLAYGMDKAIVWFARHRKAG